MTGTESVSLPTWAETGCLVGYAVGHWHRPLAGLYTRPRIQQTRLTIEIRQALVQTGGNVARAARLLVTSRDDVARHQQAKALELRARMSLSRLWQRHGWCDEAQRLLAPIYDWFTERYETADLREAGALLLELEHSEGSGRGRVF
jgi:hypothetical protein